MVNKSRSVTHVCFVTGTRAECGLMESTLRAITHHPKLTLQIIATGMHLDRRHGKTIDSIGHSVDATVPWRAGKGTPLEIAQSTGRAIGLLAAEYERLGSDVILVVGDRVEAFAAASAGHLSGKIVAHVHGGDRALGQVDDSLRHAITKLAHIHFPATKQSATRIARLGEDRWRIHRVGAPGIDGIGEISNLRSQIQNRKSQTPSSKSQSSNRQSKIQNPKSALVLLHPIIANDPIEYVRAKQTLAAVRAIAFDRIVLIHPNNDPGARGIAQCWDEQIRDPRIVIHRNVDRLHFLSLMRDAAVLVGNSSSGIIEAASFGTPVIDIGPRQLGRERSGNLTNVPYGKAPLLAALRAIWNGGNPRRFKGGNVYGGDGAGIRIANVLSSLPWHDRIRRKLIAY